VKNLAKVAINSSKGCICDIEISFFNFKSFTTLIAELYIAFLSLQINIDLCFYCNRKIWNAREDARFAMYKCTAKASGIVMAPCAWGKTKFCISSSPQTITVEL